MFKRIFKAAVAGIVSSSFLAVFLAVAPISLLPVENASAAECTMYEQSHPNFPLDGSHLSTGKCSTCASCHIQSIFLGTPKTCTACHNTGVTTYGALNKSTAHFDVTGVDCSQCHNTTSYTATWSMNHAAVTGTLCSNCHNGNYTAYNSQPKDANHIPTTGECSVCHTAPSIGSNFPQTAWNTVSHTTIHAGITTGCVTCHNGVIAIGKSNSGYAPGHPVTSDQCELCHSVGTTPTTPGFKCAMLDKINNALAKLDEKVLLAAR